jgi:hypothetical protein
MVESDPTRKICPIRSDSNPTRFDFLKNQTDLIRSDPNPIQHDSTRDQTTFNPIKTYQRAEKTQHLN